MRKNLMLVAALAFLPVAGACGQDTAGTTTTTAPAGVATTTTGAAGGAATTGAKVSANDASEAELEAALDAAGVTNAAKWAHEIEEYRPYDKDDPSLAKLKQELAKYNPGRETLDKIISVLEP